MEAFKPNTSFDYHHLKQLMDALVEVNLTSDQRKIHLLAREIMEVSICIASTKPDASYGILMTLFEMSLDEIKNILANKRPVGNIELAIDVDRPVVFLDLCGVIADTYLTRPGGLARFPELDEAYVATSTKHLGDRVHWPTWRGLKAILEYHQAQVIVVSSWLRSYQGPLSKDIKDLRDFLEYKGIVGSLVTCGGYERGDAVRRFVNKTEIKNWLVIDDARTQMYQDMAFFNNRHFVHPHGRYGLGPKELEKVDYLLNGRKEDFLEKLFELEP